MAAEAQIPALGFVSVIDDAEAGLYGGYLVLNLIGRPLEFHCTAPLKPNRAQQILYGPTLAPYLYGEQIAQALIRKAAVTPRAVFTDQAAVLAARGLLDLPIVLTETFNASTAKEGVPDNRRPAVGEAALRVDPPQMPRPALRTFGWGRQRLAIEAAFAADEQKVLQRLSDVSEDFDLTEPFQRIREAIAEASRS